MLAHHPCCGPALSQGLDFTGTSQSFADVFKFFDWTELSIVPNLVRLTTSTLEPACDSDSFNMQI